MTDTTPAIDLKTAVESCWTHLWSQTPQKTETRTLAVGSGSQQVRRATRLRRATRTQTKTGESEKRLWERLAAAFPHATVEAIEAGATSLAYPLPDGLRKHRESKTNMELHLSKKTSDVITSNISQMAESGGGFKKIESLRIDGDVSMKHLERLKGVLLPSRLALLDVSADKMFDYIETIYEDSGTLDDLTVSGDLKSSTLPSAKELRQAAPNLTGLRLSTSRGGATFPRAVQPYAADKRLERLVVSAGTMPASEAEAIAEKTHSKLEYLQLSRVQASGKFLLDPYVCPNRRVFLHVNPVSEVVLPQVDTNKTKNWHCGVLAFTRPTASDGYWGGDLSVTRGSAKVSSASNPRESRSKGETNMVCIHPTTANTSNYKTLSKAEKDSMSEALHDMFVNGSGVFCGCYTIDSFYKHCGD